MQAETKNSYSGVGASGSWGSVRKAGASLQVWMTAIIDLLGSCVGEGLWAGPTVRSDLPSGPQRAWLGLPSFLVHASFFCRNAVQDAILQSVLALLGLLWSATVSW